MQAQGTYCYNILDAIRLDSKVKARGKMGVWRISKSVIHQIELMENVNNKIKEWVQKYDKQIDNKSMYSAVTILQPFAEAIIRKIKRVENRSFRVFSQIGDNEGEFEGCRVCIKRKKNITETINYEQYGKQFTKDIDFKFHGHYKLPQYLQQPPKYRKTAQLSNVYVQE